MTNHSFDPADYKKEQRRSWDDVAAGWLAWWRTFEDGAQVVSDRLVEQAGIRLGHRVLDVATGIGEPALTAAKRVGPSGHVVATDQAPRMLALGRQRAIELGLSNIEFVETDGEELAIPHPRFDAILSRWGLMFLPNLPTALERMHGLLAEGGRLSAAVWGPPQKVPLISLGMKTVRDQLGLPPPPSDVPGPFRFADVRLLEGMLREAGYSKIHSETLEVTFSWRTPEDYTSFLQAIAAPLRDLLAEQPGDRQNAIWQTVTDTVSRYTGSDGVVRLTNETICVRAER